MKKHSNSSVTDIVLKSSRLNQIYNRTKYIEELNKYLSSHLTFELKQVCKAINFRRGSLILSIPNPSWKHKLRFEIPSLLNKLKKNKVFKGLKKIECVVTWENIPYIEREQKLPKIFIEKKYNLLKPKNITEQEQRVVKALSKDIESDDLRKALLKLANLKEI